MKNILEMIVSFFTILFYLLEALLKWAFYISISTFYLIKTVIGLTNNYNPTSEAQDDKTQKLQSRIEQDRLYNKNNGLLSKDIGKARKALNKANAALNGGKAEHDNYFETPESREEKNENFRRTQPLKEKGDTYESYIGKIFENQETLVIYNGFIKGYEDNGVDLITISEKDKTLNLIQCKNWKHKPLTINIINEVYLKLNLYKPDFYNLDPEDINFYLSNKKTNPSIISSIVNGIEFPISKTLYISTTSSILEQHSEIIKINSHNMMYKDMNIIICQNRSL